MTPSFWLRGNAYRYLCTNVPSTVLAVLELFLVVGTVVGSMCTDHRFSGLEGQRKAPHPGFEGHLVTLAITGNELVWL